MISEVLANLTVGAGLLAGCPVGTGGLDQSAAGFVAQGPGHVLEGFACGHWSVYVASSVPANDERGIRSQPSRPRLVSSFGDALDCSPASTQELGGPCEYDARCFPFSFKMKESTKPNNLSSLTLNISFSAMKSKVRSKANTPPNSSFELYKLMVHGRTRPRPLIS